MRDRNERNAKVLSMLIHQTLHIRGYSTGTLC